MKAGSRSIIRLLLAATLSCSATAFACPCFNERFLHDVFIDSTDVRCFVTTFNGSDASATITDSHSHANSSVSDCHMHTEFQVVNKNFPENSNDNSPCLNVIRRACQTLGVPIQQF